MLRVLLKRLTTTFPFIYHKNSIHICPLKTAVSFHCKHIQKYLLYHAVNRKIPASQVFLQTTALHPKLPSQFQSLSIMAENRFQADYAKMGTSSCKKCKGKLPKGSLRIAKLVTNPFSEEGGDMKQYHHPACIFETFLRARATTKIIEEPDDIIGFTDLNDEDKEELNKLIKETLEKKGSPKKKPLKQSKLPGTPSKKTAVTPPKPEEAKPSTSKDSTEPAPGGGLGSSTSGSSDLAARDNSFRQFRRLCADIAEENSYTGKTKLVATYLERGNTGDGFQGDVYLLLKLLLPGVVKSVYNLNSKQLVKIFSQIFGTNQASMVEDLEQGDVAQTVCKYFEASKKLPPQKKSTLTLQEVDSMLTDLSKHTKEDDQQKVLTKIAQKSTANDLKMVVRLIKHDLRINAGAKHVLDGLDPHAYPAFQASRNLKDVVDRVLANKKQAEEEGKPGLAKKLSIKAQLLTPVLPMLAEACKSVEYAMKKCPNGMYSEIKYDGERVQVHKKGDEFHYYSRSLKPVQSHKVHHFKEYIPKAFPHGKDLILDSEVLLIDTKTSKPLPFGTLGVHKKQAFKDASVCLFVFDCLHFNGENLMDKPIKERRKILRENMTEIPHRILFSEMDHITKASDLKEMMMKVFREGLEGLVLKDVNSIYEPGKRHWLKVKKDYLAEGAMADSADLVVLGAYFGTGNKDRSLLKGNNQSSGGLMSIFLMGVYDPDSRLWCTVSKCGSGFDDKTLDKLQKDLDMVKISKDYSKVPAWLNVNKSQVPDFVVKDPKEAPVWEITGAEFSKSEAHTADGISIRFPRCTKMRDDKTWKEATDLPRLKELYKKSKEYSDIPDVLGVGTSSTSKKRKTEENGSDSNSAPSSPKKAKGDSTPKKEKPVCKYGADCYQKSPSHKEAYSHPGENGVAEKKSKSTLPSVFKGMRFCLPESLDGRAKLERYITAYDGDVVPFYDRGSATHVVVTSKKYTLEDPRRYVTVDWLKNCIKKKKIIKIKCDY